MVLNQPQKLRLPYFIAVIGTLFFIFLCYVLRQNPIIIGAHPWLDMVFGICMTLLIATLVGVAQVSQQRAQTLKQINDDLTKEVHERIAIEESKQKLEVALLQGQKLQAIGTLAGGIAHDFNNLLYAVLGYAEMARDDVPKDSIVYKNLGKVMEAGHRGQELVARILAFSRRQQHQFDTVHLKSTIEAALALLRPTIPASVTIHFEPVTDAIIQGNQTQIHQVLVNFINNAVDAMDGEGSITINIDHIQAHDPLLKQFPNILPQNYCKIDLIDTGQGMDQPTMERIFEPFFTTKEVGKGTGLGLSIVHSIIKEHHGEITVSSQLGHGTAFTLYLPEYLEG